MVMLVSASHLVILVVGLLPAVFAGSPFHRKWGGGTRHASFSLPSNNIAEFRTSIGAYNQTDIRAGEVFEAVYEWRILDFLYDTPAEHEAALTSGAFVPENNLPLGVDQFGGRLFITTPRWKVGVPASLSVLPAYPPPGVKSPPLKPYPSWAYHTSVEQLDCSKLLSVYRIQVDECQRLWVLDAGVVETVTNLRQVCPPKIVVFDLNTDLPLFTYTLPADQVKEGSLHTNILVDVRDGQCMDAFAYIFDVWRYGITVFSLREGTSWRTTSHLYFPNPLASDYTFAGLRFQWSDGAFGASLTEKNEFNDRLMFYHPMSSYMEFMVSTSILRNQSYWSSFAGMAEAATTFVPVGDRGLRGQSSTSGISRNGIQFYNLVQRASVGCWDTNKPYTKENLGVVEQNHESINFPNDMKLDHEPLQNLWVLSNRLPRFLYAELNYNIVNFRILRTDVNRAVAGTICDPRQPHVPVTSSADVCYEADLY